MKYAVIVMSVDGWVMHSDHKSKKDATDQSDMVRGKVVRIDENGDPYDTSVCPACDGCPMMCECQTPWSAQ